MFGRVWKPLVRIYSQAFVPWSRGMGHEVSRSAVPAVPAACQPKHVALVAGDRRHFPKAVSGWQGSALPDSMPGPAVAAQLLHVNLLEILTNPEVFLLSSFYR